MKVEFENVGRGKRCWTAELASLSERALVREIQAKGALMSREVDIEFNDDGTAGIILVGGFRAVGAFRVIDGAKATVRL